MPFSCGNSSIVIEFRFQHSPQPMDKFTTTLKTFGAAKLKRGGLCHVCLLVHFFNIAFIISDDTSCR